MCSIDTGLSIVARGAGGYRAKNKDLGHQTFEKLTSGRFKLLF
jgi:hypothetical protein